MKVGQKITLTYTQSGKTMDATAFEPPTLGASQGEPGVSGSPTGQSVLARSRR